MSTIIILVVVAAVVIVIRALVKNRQDCDAEQLRNKFGKYEGAPIRCPICGCPSVGLLQGPFKWTALWFVFGWIFCLFGGGKPRNVCQRCGYTWRPGKS